jgi:predicted amidophosphoribosyltransferase
MAGGSVWPMSNSLAEDVLNIKVGDTVRLMAEVLRPTTIAVNAMKNGKPRWFCMECREMLEDDTEVCPECGLSIRDHIPWADVAAKYREEPT